MIPVQINAATRNALFALAAGACAIGFAPLFVRLSPVEPAATGFWRLALSLPFLLALRYFLRWLPLPATPSKPHLAALPATAESTSAPGDEARATHERGALRLKSLAGYWILVLPGFFFAGDLALWHWSIHYTTIANSTLLTNFAPIFVTLVAYFYFHERFDWRFPPGLVLALGGAVILISQSIEVSRQNLLGDVLGILTAVFYASYQLSVKGLRRRFSTVALMFGASLSGAVFLLLLALISGENIWPGKDAGPGGWSVLFGLAIVSHLAGQGLIAYAFAHLSASFSSVSLLIQPVVATIGAYVLFNESLGPIQLLGAAVVLSGVVLARLATRAG